MIKSIATLVAMLVVIGGVFLLFDYLYDREQTMIREWYTDNCTLVSFKPQPPVRTPHVYVRYTWECDGELYTNQYGPLNDKR